MIKSATICIRLPKQEKERLEELAWRQRTSISELIRKQIKGLVVTDEVEGLPLFIE